MILSELKLLLTDNSDSDPILGLKLAAAIDYAQTYCRNDFMVDGQIEIPPAVKLGIAKFIESSDNAVNVSSESVGGELSQSFFSDDQTKAANMYFKPFVKVRFV